MIDLADFCAGPHDHRVAMRQPYRDGDHIVATDGHIMIVLDVVQREGIDYPDCAQLGLPSFHQLDRFGPGLQFWYDIADIELPPAVTCGACLGSGTVQDENDEDAECLDCHGSGELLAWVFVGGVALNTRYLRLIADLPDCEIAPASRHTPALFRFNGGHGWIMPVNVDPPAEAAA